MKKKTKNNQVQGEKKHIKILVVKGKLVDVLLNE